jgi:peroxiredoxin Q/BCP
VILGCSADKPEMLSKFRAKHKINFPLVSDPDFHAIEAYGARRMKTFLGKSFLGIVRSSVLVGPEGKVLRVWEKVTAKGHADEVLAALAGLKKK